jgi:hypothetical protein
VNTFGDITSHVVIEGFLIVKDYHTFYKFDSTMVFIVDSNGNILPNYLMKEFFIFFYFVVINPAHPGSN